MVRARHSIEHKLLTAFQGSGARLHGFAKNMSKSMAVATTSVCLDALPTMEIASKDRGARRESAGASHRSGRAPFRKCAAGGHRRCCSGPAAQVSPDSCRARGRPTGANRRDAGASRPRTGPLIEQIAHADAPRPNLIRGRQSRRPRRLRRQWARSHRRSGNKRRNPPRLFVPPPPREGPAPEIRHDPVPFPRERSHVPHPRSPIRSAAAAAGTCASSAGGAPGRRGARRGPPTAPCGTCSGPHGCEPRNSRRVAQEVAAAMPWHRHDAGRPARGRKMPGKAK